MFSTFGGNGKKGFWYQNHAKSYASKRKKMKKFISILLFLTSSGIFGQDLHQKFLSDIDAVSKNLDYFLEGNEYIVYATPSRILYIVKNQKDYSGLIYEKHENEFKLKRVMSLEDEIPKDVFKTRNYQKGFVDLESDFYKDGVKSIKGNPTYFSYILSTHEKYCEYLLATIIDPVPFNKKVFNYISLLFLGLED